MKTRIVLGITLLALIAGVFLVDAYLKSRVAVSLLISAAGVLAWWELAILGGIGSRARGGGGALFFVGLAGTVYFLVLGWLGIPEAPSTAVYLEAGLAVLVFASFGAILFHGEPKDGFQPLLLTVIGVLFCGFLFSYLLRIYRSDGTWVAVFFLLGVKGNDIIAYFAGTAVGRTRFLKVSPKKTLEGCLAAVVFSTIWFTAGAFLRPDLLFPWPSGILLGIILSVASQIGDLSESLIKRFYFAKDSGVFLPEFGGLLDLLDSFLYCGVLFWFFLRS